MQRKTKDTKDNLLSQIHGILPVNKPSGKTAFSLIRALRKHTKEKKIGHTGTLDPFAQGLMILLIGKSHTKLSSQFINDEKEYLATIKLGIVTDTYDLTGKITARGSKVPSFSEIKSAVAVFQGTVLQIPPMFSAKKKEGKKLYQLARKGIVIPRDPITVSLKICIVEYQYPFLILKITCSKGTYIRTLAFDLGEKLGSGAHLHDLVRTRCGRFLLQEAFEGSNLYAFDLDLEKVKEKIKKANFETVSL